MALKIAIVGLPNVGKSTCFNALTKSRGAHAENFPFCTIDPNVGIVEVPDDRLSKLEDVCKPQKTIPTVVEFMDVAGLVKGASKGEGLGNQFLAHIRECDAVAHIVRFFEDGNIVHVEGKVDPKTDKDVIHMELILADLQTVEKRIDAVSRKAKSGDKDSAKELAVLERLKNTLEQEKLASSLDFNEDERAIVKQFHLLTNKPFIYIANVDEQTLANHSIDELKQKLGTDPDQVLIPLCARLEEEFIDLSDEERAEYLKELGLEDTGFNAFIQAAYEALGLITYFTAGEKEVRAWTVRKNSKAPQAAGVIHTDFEKGFICSETVNWEDFVNAGGEAKAKEQGKIRTEGKEYTVQDGDVMHFRFNV